MCGIHHSLRDVNHGAGVGFESKESNAGMEGLPFPVYRYPSVIQRYQDSSGFSRLCRVCRSFLDMVEYENRKEQELGFGVTLTKGTTRSMQAMLSTMDEGCELCTIIMKGCHEFERSRSSSLRVKDSEILLPTNGIELSYSLTSGLFFNVFPWNNHLSWFGHEAVLALSLYSLQGTYPILWNESSHRHIPSQNSLSHAVERIRTWRSKCYSDHPVCSMSSGSYAPTRVLDIGDQNAPLSVKLSTCSNALDRFVALSYCWGETSGVVQTTRATISKWEEGIPYSSLPILFQDTIQLTRALGIRYLWIDCLCIIQDDLSDWERESANMAKVYSNSYITIAATASLSPHMGLFVQRWTSPAAPNSKLTERLEPISIQHVGISHDDKQIFFRPYLHLAHDRFWNVDNAKDHVVEAPLLTRAWAFQERLLSPFTLHFHVEELVWECRSEVQCECGGLYNSNISPQDPYSKINTGYLKTCFSLASLHTSSLTDIGAVWLFIVSEFCQLSLTYETDRLPALSGLASHFSNPVLGNYITGIWEHDLCRGLLFESYRFQPDLKDTHKPLPRYVNPASLSQPTWSWTSYPLGGNHKITYDSILRFGFQKSPDLQLLGVSSEATGSNPFGWARKSQLKLRGLVSALRFRLSAGPTLRGIYYPTMQREQMNIASELRFEPDTRVKIEENEELYFLFVGASERTEDFWYALALRCIDHQASVFERVGLMKVRRRDRDLLEMASVIELEII